MHPLPPPRRQTAFGSASEARDQHSSEDTQIATQSAESTTRPGHGQASASLLPTAAGEQPRKRRKHRGGKRKKNRRQSFAAPSETSTMPSVAEGMIYEDQVLGITGNSAGVQGSFYRRHGNLSEESLESEALLDHRDQPMMRPRRDSRAAQVPMGSHRSGMLGAGAASYRQDSGFSSSRRQLARTKTTTTKSSSGEDSDNAEDAHDRTPLIFGSGMQKSPVEQGYGLFKSNSRSRRESTSTSSSRQRRRPLARENSFQKFKEYDINNPPSVPPSPQLRNDGGVDDVMVPGGDFLTRSPDSRRNLATSNKDSVINIDSYANDLLPNSEPVSPRPQLGEIPRRKTINLPTEADVCFPMLSDAGDEDFEHERHQYTGGSRRRHRRRGFPQLWVLDEWSREEKEERLEGIRAKKISEPVLVEGRLRPSKAGWHRRPEDLPYRYTYFNDEFESTIHAQTISELVQPGGSFRELFIPDPPLLSDSESELEEEKPLEIQKTEPTSLLSPKSTVTEELPAISRLNSMFSEGKTGSKETSRNVSGEGSPRPSGTVTPQREMPKAPKAMKYGRRPPFWLDVMCPTNQEMQVLSKTFGIHALTAEDIMMQEAREKVELFRHYYFINYRTFEQDTNSEDYLEPLNMYVCVFQTGVLSFHFSQIPHPANVRRRIRQLVDYLELSADWIAYGIIDDITDVYQPLIQAIESEVDEIDEQVLKLFQDTDELSVAAAKSVNNEKDDASDTTSGPSGFDLLRRIGETRKKVMSLYRLLGNKADVIKGFAKRCNEQWEVAPKSEIGLYLGDIQDHILTMTSNLSHYETLLSRAHSNYLAQINIRMNERQEQTADVLGKLTVVGTIVLPMNIICGMWGMNVKVPGQDIDNLYWFWSITAGLILFAVSCFYWAKRVYGIV